MSFAIIQTGGKQYKVKASDIVKIEKLENLKTKSKIEFNEILAYGDDKTLEVGSPLVNGAKVEAELIKNGKNKTVLIFKKRRRKNSRKKFGHRQQISLIKIMKIFSKNGKLIAEAKDLNKEKSQKTIPEKKEMAEKKKAEVPKQEKTKTKKKPLSKSKK